MSAREDVGKKLQQEIALYILAEDQTKTEGRARIAAFAAAGYEVEKTTGVAYENPVGRTS